MRSLPDSIGVLSPTFIASHLALTVAENIY
jgi:hypothetical protein